MMKRIGDTVMAREGNYKPISVQHEGKFPNHETVLFSLNDPDLVIHHASNRCRTEHPHHITECKEFESEENP